jgi:hypothetical protein
MHGPGNHGRVVEIRIVIVGKLKRPAAAREPWAIDLPISGFIQQLLGLQPVERAHRRHARLLITYFLHREAGKRAVPDR